MLFREGEIATLITGPRAPWKIKTYKVLYANKDVALIKLLTNQGVKVVDHKYSSVINSRLSHWGTIIGLDGWYIENAVKELDDDDSECI